MNQELDKQLVKKYPKIFKDRNADMKNTAICWGFECGDGWYLLLDKLCAMIQWEIDQQNRNLESDKKYNKMLSKAQSGDFELFNKYYKDCSTDKKWLEKRKDEILKESPTIEKEVYQVVATQVKEKYGSLRFYVSGGNERTEAFISFAEHLSYSICEICGSMNNIKHSQGWIITACQECISKEDNLKDRIWK